LSQDESDQRCKHDIDLLKVCEIKKQFQEFHIWLRVLVESDGGHMELPVSQLEKEIAQGCVVTGLKP
jgi:hypothetical protein